MKESLGTALITGGAKRIGREIALMLSEQGYAIALHYHQSQREAESLARTIQAQGKSCEIFQANLTDMSQVRKLIPKITHKLGAPNLLIHNASRFERVPFAETTPELLMQNMHVHVHAPFFLSQSFAENCHQGHIITMLDAAMVTTQPAYFAYLLSKKSLFELTKMMARVLSPGIRVNGIAIGLTELSDNLEPALYDRMVQETPLQDPVTVEDILLTVRQLLKQKHMTGQCLFIDSGRSLL